MQATYPQANSLDPAGIMLAHHWKTLQTLRTQPLVRFFLALGQPFSPLRIAAMAQ